MSWKVCILLIGIYLLNPGFQSIGYGQVKGLRLSEANDSVVGDLQVYIPARMKQADLPGLAVALIRNNQVVWAKGFGVVNRFRQEPTKSNSVFEVASISKVITAYTALCLVDSGLLSLDKPVDHYMEHPWLSSDPWKDKLTLRQLLSHSSGLGEDRLFHNRQLIFEPGSRFLYSGQGFQYVQALVEQVSSKSLEEAARNQVFHPLGMSNSHFIYPENKSKHISHGHMNYTMPILAFLVPYLILLLGLGGLAFLLHRLIQKSWRTSRLFKGILSAGAFITTEWLLYRLIGTSFANLFWIQLLCAIVLCGLLFLSWLALRKWVLPFFRLEEKKVSKSMVSIGWMVLSIVLILLFVNIRTWPVPINYSTKPAARGSLRSTAPDLAAMLMELGKSHLLREELSSQLKSPQIRINQDFSWGLGIGIQHSQYGDALWQHGITFAYRSLMVYYPEEGIGVVVLTNSSEGLPVACDVAERALGGEAKWRYF